MLCLNKKWDFLWNITGFCNLLSGTVLVSASYDQTVTIWDADLAYKKFSLQVIFALINKIAYGRNTP